MSPKVKIPEKVKDQLETIRKSGKVNMFEWRRIQAIANMNDMYALVVWLQDHVEEYYNGLQDGFEVED